MGYHPWYPDGSLLSSLYSSLCPLEDLRNWRFYILGGKWIKQKTDLNICILEDNIICTLQNLRGQLYDSER